MNKEDFIANCRAQEYWVKFGERLRLKLVSWDIHPDQGRFSVDGGPVYYIIEKPLAEIIMWATNIDNRVKELTDKLKHVEGNFRNCRDLKRTLNLNMGAALALLHSKGIGYEFVAHQQMHKTKEFQALEAIEEKK